MTLGEESVCCKEKWSKRVKKEDVESGSNGLKAVKISLKIMEEKLKKFRKKQKMLK